MSDLDIPELPVKGNARGSGYARAENDYYREPPEAVP